MFGKNKKVEAKEETVVAPEAVEEAKVEAAPEAVEEAAPAAPVEEAKVEAAPEAVENTEAIAPAAFDGEATEDASSDEEAVVVDPMVVLSEEIEKYDVPTAHLGHEITSITGIKHVGGVTYAVANCDDRCTYDVPITLKP